MNRERTVGEVIAGMQSLIDSHVHEIEDLRKQIKAAALRQDALSYMLMERVNFAIIRDLSKVRLDEREAIGSMTPLPVGTCHHEVVSVSIRLNGYDSLRNKDKSEYRHFVVDQLARAIARKMADQASQQVVLGGWAPPGEGPGTS